MPAGRDPRFLLRSVLGLVLAAPALAQDAPALVPASYRVAAGGPVRVVLWNAAADAPLPWDDSRISWSFLRVAGTQDNSDKAPRADRDAPAGSVRINTDGAAVVGVDFKPRVLTLDAAALRTFAHAKADAEVPETTKGDQPVRLVESAKTIIRAGKAEEGQSGNVTGRTGQLVEIRPLFDPTGIGIGSDIPVVAHADGGRVNNARVIATHLASGEAQEVRSNESGIASFRLSRAGVWRVEFHHLAEAPKVDPKAAPADGPRPAWVLSSATLTFETMPEPRKDEKPSTREDER